MRSPGAPMPVDRNGEQYPGEVPALGLDTPATATATPDDDDMLEDAAAAAGGGVGLGAGVCGECEGWLSTVTASSSCCPGWGEDVWDLSFVCWLVRATARLGGVW